MPKTPAQDKCFQPNTTLAFALMILVRAAVSAIPAFATVRDGRLPNRARVSLALANKGARRLARFGIERTIAVDAWRDLRAHRLGIRPCCGDHYEATGILQIEDNG